MEKENKESFCENQNWNNLREKYLIDINLHIPEWARILCELYRSPLKYKINDELKNEDINSRR